MPRPRRKHTGLPSYCYKDKRGRLFMLHPDGRTPEGRLKLRRESYASLDALLVAWRTTWGEAARVGAATVGDLLDGFLAALPRRTEKGEIAESTARDYARCVESLRRIWGHVRIADVDVPMLYRWRDARGEDARVRANRERTVLLEAFKPAIREQGRKRSAGGGAVVDPRAVAGADERCGIQQQADSAGTSRVHRLGPNTRRRAAQAGGAQPLLRRESGPGEGSPPSAGE